MRDEELQTIIASDEAWGESIQFAPETVAHRRALLAHIADENQRVSRCVAQLNVLIMGEGPQALNTLEECVAEMTARVQMQIGHNVGTCETVERELHHPFHATAAEMPVTWTCGACESQVKLGHSCHVCSGPCMVPR